MREWLGQKHPHQKEVWTVVVQQQMKDYADFVRKVRAEGTAFDIELAEASDHDTATKHIPNSDAGWTRLYCLGKMRVWAIRRYNELDAMWDNTQRYTELMYQLFGETINWPSEHINDLGNDLAQHLEQHRGNPEDDDEPADLGIGQYMFQERRQRSFILNHTS